MFKVPAVLTVIFPTVISFAGLKVNPPPEDQITVPPTDVKKPALATVKTVELFKPAKVRLPNTLKVDVRVNVVVLAI